MEKEIVAIDVDGTIAALDDEWLRRYNRDYNDTLTKEAWIDWNVHQFVKPECGLKMYDYLEDPTLYDNIIPIPYSQDAVKILSNYYRIIYVTNSTLGASGAKYHWLERFGFISNLDDYVECKDKTLIRADFLIDDRFENVQTFLGRGVLYNQPWNMKYNWVDRINSWKEFINSYIVTHI